MLESLHLLGADPMELVAVTIIGGWEPCGSLALKLLQLISGVRAAGLLAMLVRTVPCACRPLKWR